MNFQSATHAQVDVPYPDVDTDLYADQYHAWKDSVYRSAVLNSVRTWGTPLDYSQSFTASYKVPLNLLPVFDWVNTDASYSSNYSWERGMEDENGNSYGNTVNTHREVTLNGSFNLVKLYNHVPFLKKVNEKFNRTMSRSQYERKKQEKEKKKKAPATTAEREEAKKELTGADGAASEEQVANLKTLCKELMDKDETQEDFVQQIAMKTDGFTNITASACTALCDNLTEIIAQYAE